VESQASRGGRVGKKTNLKNGGRGGKQPLFFLTLTV